MFRLCPHHTGLLHSHSDNVMSTLPHQNSWLRSFFVLFDPRTVARCFSTVPAGAAAVAVVSLVFHETSGRFWVSVRCVEATPTWTWDSVALSSSVLVFLGTALVRALTITSRCLVLSCKMRHLVTNPWEFSVLSGSKTLFVLLLPLLLHNWNTLEVISTRVSGCARLSDVARGAHTRRCDDVTTSHAPIATQSSASTFPLRSVSWFPRQPWIPPVELLHPSSAFYLVGSKNA